MTHLAPERDTPPRGANHLPEWHRKRRARMPLSLETMYCGGRIIGDRRLEGGGIERAPLGTGFCITVPSPGLSNVRYGYLLPAPHVIARQTKLEVQMPHPFGEGALCPP